MYPTKSALDNDAGGSSPSAPPIVVALEETVEHPLQPTTKPPPMHLSRDTQLVRDLLKKAEGDTTKVSSWLDVMGECVTPDEVRAVADQEMTGVQEDDVDIAAAKLGAPETYFCPVSFHLFRDPVLLQTGQTYERCVIQRWLSEGGSICPITGVQLPKPVILTPNYALRQAVEEWAQNNAEWMMGPNGRLLPIPEAERTHFSARQQDSIHDSDTALAIRLQEEENAVQQLRGRELRAPQRPRNVNRDNMTRTQYERVQRCILLMIVLTILHFATFMYTLYRGDWKFEKIDDNPLIGFSARVLRQVGDTNTHLISEKNEWWRLITSALMTAGLVHLQWIVCCLWTFGRFLSMRISFVSLGLIYVTSSVCGVLLSANLSVNSETVASSAGTFGLMGAVFVEIIIHRKHYSHHLTSLFFLVVTAVVGVLIGTTPFVDNWASLGGLIGGVSMALALRLTHRGLQRSACCFEWMIIGIQVFWFLLVGLFIVAGCIGLVVDKESRKDCSWCKHLTCVNTKWWDCEVAFLPPDDASCEIDINGDLTANFTCPSGTIAAVQLPDVEPKTLEQLCNSICKGDQKRPSGSSDRPAGSSQPPITVVAPPTSPQDDYTSSLQNGNVEQSTTE